MKFLILAVCVLVLAACATEPEPLLSPLASPLGAPGNEASSVSQSAVISYRRSGGIRGERTSWTLFADGRLTASTGKETKLSANEVQALAAALEEAGFFALQDTYRNLRCRDCFEVEVSLNHNGQRKTVVATDDGNLPEALSRVLSLLADVAQRAL
jgi:hypothetical protein